MPTDTSQKKKPSSSSATKPKHQQKRKQQQQQPRKSATNNAGAVNKTATAGGKRQQYHDPRFQVDATFIPVDGKQYVDKSRFGAMFDGNFPMLIDTNSNNAKKAQQEHAMKNLLKQTYKTKETVQDKRVRELLEEQEKMEQEGDSDEEVGNAQKKDMKNELFGSDSDASEGDEKDRDEQEQEEEEEEEEEKQISFDEFLENLKNRPGFMDSYDDDVMNFSDNDDEEEEEGEDVWTSNDDKVSSALMRSDLWQKHLELVEEQAKAETIADGEETHRLAVTNCDWSIINATDLYVLFKTVCPSNGDVKSVTIYLSNFGKEMLEKEEKYGPQGIWLTEEEYEEKKRRERELVEMDIEKRKERLITPEDIRKAAKANKKKKKPETVLEIAKDSTETLNPEKVREYEFNKMKYYFAVVECDSKDTANFLYEQCEGQEIESTAIQLDLRFIPDETSFEDREILSQCDSLPESYKPKQNVQSKPLNSTEVHLTWDTPDVERKVLLQKNFDNMSAADFEKFIGSDSDSSDSEDEEAKQRRKEEKKLRKQQKRLEKLKEIVEEDEDGENKQEKMEKILSLEKKLRKKEKKEKKKSKKKEMKEKRKKYKDLLKLSKMEHDRDTGADYDTSQNLEVTFDTSMEEKQKELAKATKEKQLQEKESWWETQERHRKEKLKEKKKDRKKKLKSGELDKSDSDSENDDTAFDSDVDIEEFSKKEQQKQRKTKDKENKQRSQIELMMSDYKAGEGFNIKRDQAREITRRVHDDDATKQKGDAKTLQDPRFNTELLNDPDMAQDPTHPKFKKSQLSHEVAEQRRKQRLEEQIRKEKEAKVALKSQQQKKRKAEENSSENSTAAKRLKK